MTPEIRTTEPGLEVGEDRKVEKAFSKFTRQVILGRDPKRLIETYDSLKDKMGPDVFVRAALPLSFGPGVDPSVMRAVRRGLASRIFTDSLPAYKEILQNIDDLSFDVAVGTLSVADYMIRINDFYLANVEYRKKNNYPDTPEIQRYLSSSAPEEIREIMEAIPDTTSSALLKRIVTARLNKNKKELNHQMTADDYWEGIRREKEVEVKYGTQDIEIENSVDFVAQRDNVVIVPMSQEYYTLYYYDGDTDGMVFKKEDGKKVYTSDDIVDINEIEMLGIHEGTPLEERARRLQVRSDFHVLCQNKEVLESIEKDFEFPVRELTMREQLWFTASLREYSPEQEKKVIEFTKKFGLDGARAFLSCEYGDDFRNVVLGIGEKLDEKTAKEVFARYAEISDVAQTAAKDIAQDFYVEDKNDQFDTLAIEQELLGRAKDLLAKADQASSSEEVTEQLDRYRSDVVQFASIFKALHKGDTKLSFEQIRGLSFESKQGPELEQERGEMLDVFDQNWEGRDPVTATSFRSGLENALQSDKSHFYTLKKDGKVAAFIRFDELEDQPGALHGGSFNVGTELRGSGIGEAMLNQTVQYESENHTIFAEVPPEIEVGTHYVEAFDHVITGIVELPSENGPREMLAIRLDKKTAPKFKARQKSVSKKDVIKSVGKAENMPIGTRVQKFDVQKDKRAMLDAVRGASYRDEVASRYFTDPNNPNIRYLVFEQDIMEGQALQEMKVASGE